MCCVCQPVRTRTASCEACGSPASAKAASPKPIQPSSATACCVLIWQAYASPQIASPHACSRCSRTSSSHSAITGYGELHLSLPMLLRRRAAGSLLEEQTLTQPSTRLSLWRQVARGAFGDSTYCRSPSFARRGASTRERLSTSAACLRRNSQPSCHRAAPAPTRCHRAVARPLRPQPSFRGLQRASCVVCCLVNGAVERVMHM